MTKRGAGCFSSNDLERSKYRHGDADVRCAATGITYILTSLTLAILLPFLLAGSGHEQIDDAAMYRYPKRACRFLLCLIPVYLVLMAVIYTKMTPSERMADGSVTSMCMLGIMLVGFPILGYFYLDRYRVAVGNRSVTIKTIFRFRVIPLESIAQIVMVTERATDLFLFDGNNKVVAKFGGSLQDFESFLDTLEVHTRSSQVMLYRGIAGRGWKERVNDGSGLWVTSKGPAYFRAMGRREGIILGVGLSLIAIAIIVNVWLSHGGFDYLQKIGWAQ
jgi:hypothetical protein